MSGEDNDDGYSLKRRVYEARHRELEKKRKRDLERQERYDAAQVYFAPVVAACREMEREYGEGNGLVFAVSSSACKVILSDRRRLDSIELTCSRADRIRVRECLDFSSLPDPEISEHIRDIESCDEAIEEAIQWIVKYTT